MYVNRTLVIRVILFGAVLYGVAALEVDVEELESSLSDTITFVNYTGSYDDINTIDEIRGIGVFLSSEIESGESTVFAGKYRIVHILPLAESGLRGADLLELLPGARVDHIDNLQRIISAYLETRYDYSREDSDLLGRLVTIYNAVHRGNVERFRSNYVLELLALLQPETAGLSLDYREWAGGSQIIIPIAADAAPGQLSSVPADELLDEAVEETLRDSEDLGLEERMETADLIDRTVDEETTEIQEERAAIQTESRKVQRESRQLQEEIQDLEEEITSLPGDSSRSRELEADLANRQQQQEEVASRQEELESRSDAADQRESQTRQADGRSREIREDVARDVETISTGKPNPLSPLRVKRSRIANSALYSTLVIIDANEGEVLQTSRREIIGREILIRRQGIVAISEEGGTPVLVLLDGEDLSFISRGEARLSRYSPLLASGDGIYAVVSDGGEWYAGRFDANLNLLFRSSIPVDEGSDLVIQNNQLIVQRKDGRFTRLSLDELGVEL